MQQTEQNTNLSALTSLIQKELGSNVQNALTKNEQAEISKLALGATDLDQVVGGIKPATKDKLAKIGKVARIGGEVAAIVGLIVLAVIQGKSHKEIMNLKTENDDLTKQYNDLTNAQSLQAGFDGIP